MDDDGSSGSGIGQRWMMMTFTLMTTAAAAVDNRGGAPPLPLPSLLTDALTSLSLPALLGLPLLASS